MSKLASVLKYFLCIFILIIVFEVGWYIGRSYDISLSTVSIEKQSLSPTPYSTIDRTSYLFLDKNISPEKVKTVDELQETFRNLILVSDIRSTLDLLSLNSMVGRSVLLESSLSSVFEGKIESIRHDEGYIDDGRTKYLMKFTVQHDEDKEGMVFYIMEDELSGLVVKEIAEDIEKDINFQDLKVGDRVRVKTIYDIKKRIKTKTEIAKLAT